MLEIGKQYILQSTGPIWVKNAPDLNSKSVNVLKPDTIITILDISNKWIRINIGWVYPKNSSGDDIFSEIQVMSKMSRMAGGVSPLAEGGETPPPTPPPGKTENVEQKEVTPAILSEQEKENIGILDRAKYAIKDLGDTIREATEGSLGDIAKIQQNFKQTELIDTLSQSLNVNALHGIFGAPYQFMDTVDSRLSSSPNSLGRKYAERIVGRMPLLLIMPGTPVFLSKFSESEKQSILGSIVSGADSDIDGLLKREGRYYTLKTDSNDYYTYVGPAARAGSSFLGIGSTQYNGGVLESYNWFNHKNPVINNTLAYRGAIPFYVDSETQIRDSFGNSTTQSMLEQKVNGVSDLGREINFLLGNAKGATGVEADKFSKGLHANQENVQDFTNRTMNSGNMIDNIIGNLATVIAGGKLIFPEIWSDSNFDRSYDVSIKLTTPDCDKISWYLNIYVPLIHLIGFVMPRQSGVNGYISPFLVRAYYKGMLNCDMGIITNMEIQKGDEGVWNKFGLPNTVIVNFTIKELYHKLSLSSTKNLRYNLINNIMLMDYLANMCGINLNEPDIMRTIDLYLAQKIKNPITDAINLNIIEGFHQGVNNVIKNWVANNARF